jgi:3-hydroxybutyryl-CoA dehydrogenase
LNNQKSSGKALNKFTVIGFGLMGAQISQVLALAGYTVIAYDVNEGCLEKGLDLIRSGRYGLEKSVKSNRISKETAEQTLSRIATSTTLKDALKDSDFVLEAAVEDLPIKQTIFLEASRLTPKEAVLATNTSTISISKQRAA